MADGYLLNQADRDDVGMMLAWFRRRFGNDSKRPPFDPDAGQFGASDVYIVRVPDDGIPALTVEGDEAGTGTGTEVGTGTGTDAAGDLPGSAECDVYQILRGDTGRMSVSQAVPVTVYNISTTALNATDTPYALAVKDKAGTFVLVGAGGSVGDGDGDGIESGCTPPGRDPEECLEFVWTAGAGRCSNITAGESPATLTSGWWESDVTITTAAGAGTVSYRIGSTGYPEMKVTAGATDYYGTPAGCDSSGRPRFAFGGPDLCDGTVNDQSCDNGFYIAVGCVPCPIDDPCEGWYCCDETGEVQYVATCDDLLLFCSNGTGTGVTSLDCGLPSGSLPPTLKAVFSNTVACLDGLAMTLSKTPGGPPHVWQASKPVGCPGECEADFYFQCGAGVSGDAEFAAFSSLWTLVSFTADPFQAVFQLAADTPCAFEAATIVPAGSTAIVTFPSEGTVLGPFDTEDEAIETCIDGTGTGEDAGTGTSTSPPPPPPPPPPATEYDCIDGFCVESPGGPYSDLGCGEQCSPPPGPEAVVVRTPPAPAPRRQAPTPLRRKKSSGVRVLPPPQDGPGTELKTLLAELGLVPGAGCKCNERVAAMNRWGLAGCAEPARRAEILDWLRKEAAKASWATKLRTAVLAAGTNPRLFLSPTDPLGALLDEALRRAGSKESPR